MDYQKPTKTNVPWFILNVRTGTPELSITTLKRKLVLPFLAESAVEPQAALFKGKSLPKTVEAHEVHAVDTLLQLFSKVDLQTALKPADC